MAKNNFEELKNIQRVFVSIKIVPGKENKVMEELMSVDGISEIHFVPGDYDYLVVLDLERHFLRESHQTALSFVTEKIRSIKEISETNTLVPAKSMIKKH